jgi:hypothetical protein
VLKRGGLRRLARPLQFVAAAAKSVCLSAGIAGVAVAAARPIARMMKNILQNQQYVSCVAAPLNGSAVTPNY